MGRFYKATPGQFIQDKMFQIPFSEIASVIGKADADISKNEEEILALQDTLKLQALTKDKEYSKEKIRGYEDQITDMAQDLYDNPLAFRAKTASMRALSRKIKDDFETGEAFQIQSAYDTRQKNLADMQEAWKKNPDDFDYEDINKLMALNDAGYQGFAQGYQTDMLKTFQDIDDVEEIAKGYKPDSKETLGAYEKDGRLYTSKDMTEEVDPNVIRKNIQTHLMQDKKLNDYYRQQIRLGNITAEEYVAKLNATADRMAEKYGYKKTSKGITSIKGDPKATADYVYGLNNPTTNITPGSIYDQSLADKYAVDGVVDNTVAGIDNVIGRIETDQQTTVKTVASLAGKQGIDITPQMSEALAQGDFSVLKGIKSPTTGKSISNAVLLQEKKKWDALDYDKQILDKKKTIANTQDNPDQFLADMSSDKSVIDMIGDFQTAGIVTKENSKAFNTAVDSWRDEITNSRGWYNESLKFDSKDLAALPDNLKEQIQDGDSIVDLIKKGVIQVKTIGGKPVTAMEVLTEDMMAQLLQEKGLEMPEKERAKDTDSYQNFTVGEYAKPTLGLDGSGNAQTQFEISISGFPIKTYMNENALKSGTVSQYMDKNKMMAAHKINEAISEGVINEEDFYIDGINFTKTGGQTFANDGEITIEEAIKAMSIKDKNDTKAMLTKPE